MEKKKMTKKEVISEMLKVEEIVANDNFKAYLENELALLNKKAENKKPTKAQAENENYKVMVLEALANEEKGLTVTEIQAKSETLKGFSNQKVSALVRILIEEGKVAKATEGKKALFKLA